MINKTLAILAGGKGSRMNYTNKAMLSYKDKAFIEHLIENGESFKEILVVVKDKNVYKNFEFNCDKVKIVEDIYKEKGPMGGIYTALKVSKFDKVFCVACDMPLLTKSTLEYISKIEFDEEILVPIINEKFQPLCAIYSKTLLNKIKNNLENNNNKMTLLIKNSSHKIINYNLSSIDFFNVNTYEEYFKLKEF